MYVVNLKWKFIYLGRRPIPSPLLSPDVLADVDVVDLKLSNREFMIYDAAGWTTRSRH